MNSDLLRQRRNILIISCILILFDFANVTIGRVTLLGTQFIIGRPEVIEQVTWLFWAYSLLRYYQYVRVEDDLEISSRYMNYFGGLVDYYARSDFQSKGYDIPNWIGEDVGIPYRKTNFLRHEYVMQGNLVSSDGEPSNTRNFPIPWYLVIIFMMKSASHVMVHTPRFTDYILPFIVAIGALVVNLVPSSNLFFMD